MKSLKQEVISRDRSETVLQKFLERPQPAQGTAALLNLSHAFQFPWKVEMIFDQICFKESIFNWQFFSSANENLFHD